RVCLGADDAPAAAPTKAAAPAAAADTPWGPEKLPGRGIGQHGFLYAGEGGGGMHIYIVRGGQGIWSYTHPGKREISDATLRSNGNNLFAHQFGVTLISPDQEVVWNLDAPEGTEIHTAAPMGLERVMYIQNGNPAKLKVVNIKSGATEKEFDL